ncbi:MAG: SWIM zinc finger family protein, partial [Nitrospirae bacterium]|nr:SWIM zinc finger family protein [Nitrospirota bacterium]
MILEQPEVYTSLKTIPLNTIYTLGSREVLIRGFEYVKGKKLELYEWNYDFSILTAYVRGTRRYKVKVFMQDDQIHCTCTCPAWVPAFPCKHVICVLLTTKSLLSPEVSSIPLSDSLYKASLLKSLSIESKESLNENSPVACAERFVRGLPYKKPVQKKRENRVEVVIDVRFSAPVLSLRKNGARVFSPQDIPEELASSFYHSFSGYSTFYAIRDVASYLERFGNAYPLVLETQKGNRLLRWEPELKVKTWTELDASGKKVSIKAGCLIDGAACENFFRFSGFLADLEKNRLIKMEKEEGGWRLFDRLRDLFYGYEDDFDSGEEVDSAAFLDGEQVSAFEAPNDHFKSAQILLEADFRKELSNRLILKVNGEVSPLLEGVPDCRLSIHLNQGNPEQAQLKTETRMGQTAGATLTSLFRLFPVLETGKKFHPPLSAQKRKKVIYDIFFRLLQADKKSKPEKIIREGLLEGDFSRAETKKSAKQVLRYFHSIFKAEDERIWLNEGRWFVSRNDKAKEALLYQIPYELFGGDVFKGMAAHDKMSVPLSRLHENLSALYLKLKEHGIELYYNHKQVRSSSWEFSFDLTRSTGIDWFEIKPEIRCGGEEVKEKIWRDFLSRKGVVEREDSVQVVDSNAQAIMKSIFDLSRTSAAVEGDKKEIVRMPRFQLLDWISLRKEGVIIKLLPEDERLIDRLTHFEKIEKIPLPDNLKATLRPYQKE